MKVLLYKSSVVSRCMVLVIIVGLLCLVGNNSVHTKNNPELSKDQFLGKTIEENLHLATPRIYVTKMPSLCMERLCLFSKDVGKQAHMNQTTKTGMKKVGLRDLKTTLTVLFLLILILSPADLLFGKSNSIHRKQYSKNELCYSKEKSAYDFVFDIHKMCHHITVGMLPNNPKRYTKSNSEHPVDRKKHDDDLSTDSTVHGAACSDVSDREGGYRVDSRHNNGFTLGKVSHPDFVDRRARDESFRDWPRSNRPDVALLSDAGFYSIGHGDTVRCFCCGGGLSGFTSDTDPYEDHLRYYPKCEYMRHHTGNKHSGPKGTSGASVDGHERVKSARDKMDSTSSPQDRKTALTYSEIRSLLEMGFKRQLIEDLIYRQLSNGNNDVTTDSIIESLIANEPANVNVAAKVEEKRNDQLSNKQDADVSTTPRSDQEGDTCPEPRENDSGSHTEKNTPSEKSRTTVKDVSSEETVDAIKQENDQLKEQMLCKICLDRTSSIVFLDCGHMVACGVCAPSLRKCPICRKLVKGRIQVT